MKAHHSLFVPLVLCAAVTTAWADGAVDFNRDIRPILATSCFACHGPDEGTREADLRLDTAAGATFDLGGYRAVEAGQPETSELIRRIESDDEDLVMPPPDSGHELSEDEKRLLRAWVASGGRYEVHWSFTPPLKARLPAIENSHWPRNAIDHFVLARLEASGLSPNPETDRYRLLRRISLDLTGLPPTPEEADAFVADTSDDAVEVVVERMLSSDAFGEHWARLWLDLARYADTRGYEKDRPRDIWRYRDWVIQALNDDMPFDQFTIEQLAGDLLPDATTNQLLATAFHRNTMTNEEGGTDDEEFRVAAVKDRVDTTLQVWMGLTMGCAKCHSHKYDPISQQDYYAFYAFFNQTEDADRGNESPVLRTPTGDQERRIAMLEARLSALEEQQSPADEGESEPEVESVDQEVSNAKEQDELAAQIEAARKELETLRNAVPQTPIMRELPQQRLRATHIHHRGNFLTPGDPITSNVPALFGTFPQDAERNRLGVARWLLQAENPLTARVAVNRVWARIFGIGIVETEEDFGTQGSLPSHQELLDWLAVDFREQGWSLKQLLRTMVLSATYRQSTAVSDTPLTIDPRNRLLGRGPRFRLAAETVRDQALAVSGLLTNRIGGPSVMPPQPDGIWQTTYSALSWENAEGPNRFRRALYTYWKRTSPYPSMLTFDAGTGEVCQIRRVRTNTPLQALVLLNDPVYIEAAGALADRMAHVEGDLADQMDRGFRLAVIRPPTDEETKLLIGLYESLSEDFAHDTESASRLVQAAGREEGDAAMIAVANVLLNLDETLMKP